MTDNLLNNNMPFLTGGGEMGKLTREKDWSNTALGSPENWPQSLRTSLSIILNSKFPMFLFWGRELVCFYNDAYRPSLGKEGKHPAILGMKAEDAWAEIWNFISPLIEKVLANGEATWHEDQLLPIYRNGKMEDVYWTFSYSPVTDESGKPAGVFVTCTETTEKILIYNKLEHSKNKLEFTIEAAGLGTFDYFPLTNKFSANNRLKKWFGLPADEQIELYHALNAVAENDRKRVAAAIEKAMVFSNGGIYDIEYTIIHPITKEAIIVIAKGKVWFNDEKIAYRFNGTLQDVTEQSMARRKIEMSEQRFEAAVKAVDGILWTNNAAGEMEGEQPAWANLTGQQYNDYQGYGWAAAIHPDDAALTVNVWNEAVKERKMFVFEHRVKLRDNSWGNFSVRAMPIFNADGSIREWVGVHTNITVSKKAEEKVRESEERFRLMAENTEVLIAVGDETTNATYFNKAWVNLLGRPVEELLKFGWVDLIHPDDRKKLVDIYLKAFNERKPFSGEFRVIKSNKQYSWLLAKSSPRFHTDGAFAGYISSAIDITERKKAEEDLTESLREQQTALQKLGQNETKLNLIINASELGTWEVDMTTKAVVLSDRYLEIAGYKKKSTLTLEQTLNFIHPDDLPLNAAAFKKAFETGSFSFTGRMVWEDKSVHWIESKGKVFYDEQHNPVNLIGTISDITEEKRQQQILSDSEQKFRLLANSMPQNIWTSDTEGNLNYFNKSVFDYSGLTPQQIDTDGWIEIIHPDDREENVKAWIAAITTGKDFILEHRFRRYDGVYRWQLSRAIPQKDEQGKIQMWVGTSTDIEDQKIFSNQLEKQVLERTGELEQKNIELENINKELQSFAYISSHDLQEPLRKIQTFVTRIIEKEYHNLSESGKDQFRRMQNAAKRMQTLIDDLLAYSQTNTAERKYELINLDKIVEEVKEDLKEELQQKNATVEISDTYAIKIIPFQFRQLLHNLLSNSLKFSIPDKEIFIKIKSEIVEGNKLISDKLIDKKKYCHISVSDNGIGFEQQYSEKIFELFQRLHGRTEYNGTGIGLAIVKKIVDNHNGVITANAKVNEGATFNIYIPVAAT